MSQGRVVVVTGASGHLGSAIARLCAGRGYSVAVHYRSNDDAARDVVDSIEQSGGVAAAFPADLGAVSDPDVATRLIDDVVNHWGRVDGLVHCSAKQSLQPFDELRDSDWQAMWEANFLAATRISRAALPRYPVDRHHLVRRGISGLCQPRALCGVEGGVGILHSLPRARDRTTRDASELRSSRFDRTRGLRTRLATGMVLVE